MTLPATPAEIGISILIASTAARSVSASTLSPMATSIRTTVASIGTRGPCLSVALPNDPDEAAAARFSEGAASAGVSYEDIEDYLTLRRIENSVAEPILDGRPAICLNHARLLCRGLQAHRLPADPLHVMLYRFERRRFQPGSAKR
ncbi:hypothetical protein CHELA20_40252 [Hyphomicrobiales bacterium]|nr:hypothetical protein CHELA20_40252 [Hyphomicrobiales bacterium]CAH1687893.1 hypothetical protein CHELA41_40107 [Hyphomicrobiales bacterium]